MTTATPGHTVLKREPQLLPVPLTDQEMVAQAEHIARLYDDIATLEADERAAKALFKQRAEALDSQRQATLATIRRRAEDRPIEVEIRAMYDAAQIITVRTDTWETVDKRNMTPEERQGHLFPPTADDAFESGVLAARWFDDADGRPEPGNKYKAEKDARSWVCWEAGFNSDPDPRTPWSSAYEEGRMASAEATCPFADGTPNAARWKWGRDDAALPPDATQHGDTVDPFTAGRETRYRRAEAIVAGTQADQSALLVNYRTSAPPPAVNLEGDDMLAWLRGYEGRAEHDDDEEDDAPSA